MHRVRFHIRGEATGLHPIQRKTAGEVAGNLVGVAVECWDDETGGNRGNGENSPPAWGLPIVSTPWEPSAAGFASVDGLGAMPLDDSRSPPQSYARRVGTPGFGTPHESETPGSET